MAKNLKVKIISAATFNEKQDKTTFTCIDTENIIYRGSIYGKEKNPQLVKMLVVDNYLVLSHYTVKLQPDDNLLFCNNGTKVSNFIIIIFKQINYVTSSTEL